MEEEYEYNLATCGSHIKDWKKRYCKKNSKYPMKITVKLWHTPDHECFWKRYLILDVNGVQKEIIPIRPEAFDTLTSDQSLPRTDYPGSLFVKLFEYSPNSL